MVTGGMGGIWMRRERSGARGGGCAGIAGGARPGGGGGKARGEGRRGSTGNLAGGGRTTRAVVRRLRGRGWS